MKINHMRKSGMEPSSVILSRTNVKHITIEDIEVPNLTEQGARRTFQASSVDMRHLLQMSYGNLLDCAYKLNLVIRSSSITGS